jgi:hypothetical protein
MVIKTEAGQFSGQSQGKPMAANERIITATMKKLSPNGLK